MEDDIVERLRAKNVITDIIKSVWTHPGRHPGEIIDLMKGAANEIERLRKDVKTAIMCDSAELRDAKKEIERLRQAIEQDTKILVPLINDAIREKEHE